jgi:hypothetical protein
VDKHNEALATGAQRTIMATPYRARIVEYCQGNGIVVPKNFDAPQSSGRFVLVDASNSPPILFSRSTYQEKQLLEWARELMSQGKNVRFLDFKRRCELVLDEHGKLLKGAVFDALSSEERRRLEWRKQHEA